MVGPSWRVSTWRSRATSAASEDSGNCGAVTLKPSACSRSITAFQLDPSAHAPWTRTMFSRVLMNDSFPRVPAAGFSRLGSRAWVPRPGRPGSARRVREPVAIGGRGPDGAVLRDQGIARRGAEQARGVVGDDGAVVVMGGEGDLAEFVEVEDFGPGDIAGAFERRARADVGHGPGDVS